MSEKREPMVNWGRLAVMIGGIVIIYFTGVGFNATFFPRAAKPETVQWVKDGDTWRDPASGVTIKEIKP